MVMIINARDKYSEIKSNLMGFVTFSMAHILRHMTKIHVNRHICPKDDDKKDDCEVDDDNPGLLDIFNSPLVELEWRRRGRNPARSLLNPQIQSQEGDDDEDEVVEDNEVEVDDEVDVVDEDSDCDDSDVDDDENPWLWTYLTVHWKRGDITQQAVR